MAKEEKFWRNKTLEDMTKHEWESLCDDCGLCCLVRLEDEDTGDVHETNVICRHYDCSQWQCSAYTQRSSIKHGCVKLTPKLVREFDWLPDSCAYRVVMEGRELPESHPLLRGSDKVVPEQLESVQQISKQVGLIQDSSEVVHEHHLITMKTIQSNIGDSE